MSEVQQIEVAGKTINVDKNGYLVNLGDWSKDVANYLAKKENINLTDDHWEVIDFLRKHYSEFNNSPNIVLMVKVFAKNFGEEKGNKDRLYGLFPKGPARQGCRIAGLPLPNDCVDWPQ
ncbi:MAG: TusE/DsrC/DsvC family sulfur relay protein [Gammaproteobacteria bacterium]|nr:TusE/DsrC/DsvC family sulfur relay protein [Gammaproteobacteria bacterium]